MQAQPNVTISKQWNTSSSFLVSMDGKLLGTIYMPRGRMWGMVCEEGHPTWHDQIAACRSIEDGAAILVERATS